MNTIQFKTHHELSAFAAGEIINAIKHKPSLTLCMASGHTPALTCELLAKKLKEDKIDYSGITFIGLDEWVGLPPSNEGSCRYFFQQKIVIILIQYKSNYKRVLNIESIKENLEKQIC